MEKRRKGEQGTPAVTPNSGVVELDDDALEAAAGGKSSKEYYLECPKCGVRVERSPARAVLEPPRFCNSCSVRGGCVYE